MSSLAFLAVAALLGPPMAAPSGDTFTYCVSKQNSLGCTPVIRSEGTPSASATSGFVVSGVRIRNQQRGLLFYGVNGRAAIPFKGGVLCVAPAPLRRTPQMNSAGSKPSVFDCTGRYDIDMNSFSAGLVGGNPLPELSLPGTVVNCQWWTREPTSSFGTGLTNALQYTIGM